MSAVAPPPASAAHAPSEQVGPQRTYAPIAPLTSSSSQNVSPNARASKLPADNASPTASPDDGSTQQQHRPDGKRSPLSLSSSLSSSSSSSSVSPRSASSSIRRTSTSSMSTSMSPPMHKTFSDRRRSSSSRTHSAKFSPTSRDQQAPKIVVKKEPSSPDMPTARHRPRRLDLSHNAHIVHSSGALTARPSGPMSSKDSASVQDIGLACLSPGFHTQDPTMREQLQRSIDVRERQRQIIEARQKQGKGPAHLDDEGPRGEMSAFGRPMKTPTTSRRKGPPPGLSIAPPSHQQFADERVIQSAPINQSFTGLRSTSGPMGPSHLSQTSHIHHVPANQTNNRLPPISDVFPDRPRHHPYNNSPGHSSHSNNQPPLPSPGFPPHHHQPPPSARRREYSSAEEAAQAREDQLPRPLHYGGHQPPTPPSPIQKQSHTQSYPSAHPEMYHSSSNSRRRGRDEYERDNGTPPLGHQQPRPRPFEERTPEAERRRKEEFMRLVSQAWDLFHQR